MNLFPLCLGALIGCVTILAPVTLEISRRADTAHSGSGQVYACPKGATYSVGVQRQPDGTVQTYVFREPGHRLAATVSPLGAHLDRYPSPCDYLERPRT